MLINPNSATNTMFRTGEAASTKSSGYFAEVLSSETSALQSNKGHLSIPVGSLQDITHLLTPLPPDKHQSSDNSPVYPTQDDIDAYSEHMESQRYRRKTEALVWVNDQVVAEFNYGGSWMLSDEARAIFDRSGLSSDEVASDPWKLISLLERELSGSVKVDSFQPGTGPTEAEKWEMVHGYSYDRHIRYALNLMYETRTENQRREAEIAARLEREDSVPQRTVFRTNGIILGSINEEGRFQASLHSLIQEVDEAGLSRDVVRDLLHSFQYGGATEQRVTDLLSQAFGDTLAIEQHEPDESPTRGEIRQLAMEQFTERYHEIHPE